jgi:hypothetical protein
LGGVFCFFILPQWQVTEAQPKHYFQKLWDGCESNTAGSRVISLNTGFVERQAAAAYQVANYDILNGTLHVLA